LSESLQPATIKYECNGCGDCCRIFWVIPLLPAEADILAKLKWTDECDHLNHTEKVVESKDAKGRKFHRLAKKTNSNECVFLGPENRCLIHQEFGEASKPSACRQFPRTRMALDGKTVTHFSLLCSCVELLPEVTDVYAVDDNNDPTVSGPSEAKPKDVKIKFRGKSHLKWMPFEDIWHDLMSFFDHDDLNLVDAMRCSWKYLTMIFEGDPNLETGKMMRDAFRESLPGRVKEMPFADRMDDTQRSLFFQLMYYSTNPAPVDFYELSITEQARIKQARQKQGEQFRDEKGTPCLFDEQMSCTFSEVRKVEFPNGDGGDAVLFKKLLKAFLIAKGAGLRFHQETDDQALASIHVLLLSLPQCIWLSKAIAANDSRSVVEKEDLLRAVRVIDGSVGNVDSSMFSGKMKEAWEFLFTETDFAAAATSELVNS